METVLTNDRFFSGREDALSLRTSFEEIYALYKIPVFRFACSLTGNAHEAEDLFQETWLRVVASFPGNPDLKNIKAWIFKITINLHRDALRKKKVRRLFLLARARKGMTEAQAREGGWETGGESPSDDTDRADFRLCLERAIATLPRKQRRVFVLKEIEGFKHVEIGRILGIPENTVKTIQHRAVKKLQQDLREFHPSGPSSDRGKERQS